MDLRRPNLSFLYPLQKGGDFEAADEGAFGSGDFEGDDHAAVEEGFHFEDGVAVEDHLAVNPEEGLGVEGGFDVVDGAEKRVFFFIIGINVDHFLFEGDGSDVADGYGVHFFAESDEEGGLSRVVESLLDAGREAGSKEEG